MKKLYSLLLFVFISSAAVFAQNGIIRPQDIARADSIVRQMTLEEKCAMLSGKMDGFHTQPLERLGVPSVGMADGPQGVRNNTHSTYYPCGIAVAASWNRHAAREVGAGIGTDAKARGVAVMLCPGVNIYRSPLCGRNFEYMGEDPYLASEQAVQYIEGMQGEGVCSTIKHFAANNQEYQRHQVNSIVDERTLNEIYFPVFRKAVEVAHVGAVMTSYNPLNGRHAAENPWLVDAVLRGEWGFKGIVMSDWFSTYTTFGLLMSGLDIEMPYTCELYYDKIKPLVDKGIVSEERIDRMCRHMLQTFSSFGFLDRPMKDSSIPLDCEQSRQRAHKMALEAPVLLKNDGILPLTKGKILVMGPNADKIPFGGGSGAMSPIDGTTTTLLEGMRSLGRKYSVDYMGATFDRKKVESADAIVMAVGFDKDSEKEGFDRKFDMPEDQDSLILKVCAINPNVVVVINSGGEVNVGKWISGVRGVMMSWYLGQETGSALAELISGKVSPSGKLPFTFWGSLQANPSSPYYKVAPLPEWNERIRKALPIYTDADLRSRGNWRDGNAYNNTVYGEGIFIGYRAVGQNGQKDPMFPFGYGLSYSSFDYSDFSVVKAGDGWDVSFKVTNTGACTASEAAQVYVGRVNSHVPSPLKELKGYDKVELGKGETAAISIHLSERDLAYYDLDSHGWKVDDCGYRLYVGASSSDIKYETALTR